MLDLSFNFWSTIGTAFRLTMLVWWQLQRSNSLIKLIQMVVCNMYFSNKFIVENLSFSVPVILIFTKFESQESNAFNKLQTTCSYDDALLQAPHYARREFDEEHLSRFKDRRYPPLEIVYLKGECSHPLFINLLKYESHWRYAKRKCRMLRDYWANNGGVEWWYFEAAVGHSSGSKSQIANKNDVTKVMFMWGITLSLANMRL